MLRSLLLLSVALTLGSAAAAQESVPMPRPRDGVPPPPAFPQPIVPGQPPAIVTPAYPPTLAFPIPTHQQAAAALKPAPGKYRLLVLHPRTCKPVEVCFELPDRCAKYVKATKDEIEIRYGLFSYVKIRFCKDGEVKVKTGCCT